MPKKRTFKDYLKDANDELRKGNIRLTIEQRESRLCLRGIFPPKPTGKGSDRTQQRLAIGPANLDGLETAKAKAKEIAGKLELGSFRWENYLSFEPKEEDKPIKQILEDFKAYWLEDKDNLDQALRTFKTEYLAVFKHLPENEQISTELLRSIILKSSPNTRSRRRYALACAALADFVGFSHNLRGMVGNYSGKAVNPRDLPDDEEISKIIYTIDNPSWRWAYGMMACYGLRNHEVFFVDLDDYPIAYVNRGKTRERYVWPLYPEWADQWKLKSMLIPACTGKVNSDFGARVTSAFDREELPFSPYNLRHCWARRSIDFGLDVSLAAAQMGHSVKVHCEIYHLWIDKKTHEKAMNIILNNPNRPLPPTDKFLS